MRAAPAISRAKAEKKTHTSIQVRRRQSGLPCAMVLAVSFELSSVTGCLATVAPGKLASQELDASIGAPGPHDFAVRDRSRSSVVSIPSIASHRTFVTIASRPSCRVGRAHPRPDLRQNKSGIFFAWEPRPIAGVICPAATQALVGWRGERSRTDFTNSPNIASLECGRQPRSSPDPDVCGMADLLGISILAKTMLVDRHPAKRVWTCLRKR